MIYLITGILGIIIGAVAIYIIFLPQLKRTQEINYTIAEQNEKAQRDVNIAKINISRLNDELNKKYQEFHSLQEKLEKDKLAAENNAKTYQEKVTDFYKQKLQSELLSQKEKFQQAIEECQREYLNTLEDSSMNYKAVIENLNQKVQEQEKSLSNLDLKISSETSIALAAVEANKRIAEQALQKDFYRLVLSKDDIEEIEELRKCGKHLRNPEPLNKVIWKVYYENPYTSLIGRVVGPGIHCGIYKITNLQNGMCYVGQAVNIAERWRQHIKRGLGAETPTKNKLYPAMLENGVENFSFEIIEECPREQLNDKEDYWQNFFKAKEFGYSIK